MRKIFATWVLVFSALNVTAQDFKPTNEDYDTSESMVKASVSRTKYYIKDSFLNISINSEEFLKEANRDKPTVIYLHGCSYDNLAAERTLLKFYLSLGFNYAATDFIKRGDATKSCEVVNGALIVRANGMKRLPARVLELNAHIDWLRENGFKKIYVVGYSEGGLVIQRMQKAVDAVIIHAMSCLTLSPDAKRPTNQNKYLQLMSANDPFLTKTIGAVTCEGRAGYETFSYAVGNSASHDPFSDPLWAERIKEFLGIKDK